MGKAADRARSGEAAPGGSEPGSADEGMAARAEADAEREAASEVEASADDPGATPPVPETLMEDLREVRLAATAAIGAEAAGTAERGPVGRGPSAAVLAASLFLVGCALLSVSFMLTRGGLALPSGSPPPSEVALASPSPEPTPAASSSPVATAAPTPTPAAPTPSPTAAPTPTSSLLALLKPCPDKPDCYLYTVKTNDSLARIARKFGVLLDAILELNPSITDVNIIHPGDEIAIPPPTR